MTHGFLQKYSWLSGAWAPIGRFGICSLGHPLSPASWLFNRPEVTTLLPGSRRLLSWCFSGLKQIRDWLTKHSKAGESRLSLAHTRKPSAKSERIWRPFPVSSAFSAWNWLCSPDACGAAKSRLFQHAEGVDSGSDKGQRMEALRGAFVSPRLRPLWWDRCLSRALL